MTSSPSDDKSRDPLLLTSEDILPIRTYSQSSRSKIMRALIVGFCVGASTQISAMGLWCLFIKAYGYVTMTNCFVFEFCWALVTSIFSLILYQYMFPVAVSNIPLRGTNKNEETSDNNDTLMRCENRFVMGAMIGTCLPWTVADMVLGLKTELLASLVILNAGLLLCQCIFTHFRSRSASNTIDSNSQIVFDEDIIYVKIV